MIRRIVKMEFREEELGKFLELFQKVKEHILNSQGCLSLELLYDIRRPQVIITLSSWRSEEDLQNYRKSALFEETWAQSKALFASKPEAWSVENIYNSEKN